MLSGELLCAVEVVSEAPFQFGSAEALVTGEHRGQSLEVSGSPGGFLSVLLGEGFEGKI